MRNLHFKKYNAEILTLNAIQFGLKQREKKMIFFFGVA